MSKEKLLIFSLSQHIIKPKRSVDSFYSEENMAKLKNAIQYLNKGKETVHKVNRCGVE